MAAMCMSSQLKLCFEGMAQASIKRVVLRELKIRKVTAEYLSMQNAWQESCSRILCS